MEINPKQIAVIHQALSIEFVEWIYRNYNRHDHKTDGKPWRLNQHTDMNFYSTEELFAKFDKS